MGERPPRVYYVRSPPKQLPAPEDPSQDDEWSKQIRRNVGTIATLIATMSLQNAMNPPGGVVQTGNNGSVTCPTPMVDGEACPGQSVFAAVDPVRYTCFMLANALSFILSMITCFFVISGIPVDPGLPTKLLGSFLSLSIFLLLISFWLGARILTPSHSSHAITVIAVFCFLFIVGILLYYCFVASTKKSRRGSDAATNPDATSFNQKEPDEQGACVEYDDHEGRIYCEEEYRGGRYCEEYDDGRRYCEEYHQGRRYCEET
ncbi:hypothetical protein PIB30_051361 [Stylosanthes scabra]|uniref:PGG domain-containing protein n=1 Tax=Stylosanthes scabra TaxID=79078 RepID=A0ABU6QHI2_9FABA|nr:hypothetical protein [Stylosanthes scabra]